MISDEIHLPDTRRGPFEVRAIDVGGDDFKIIVFSDLKEYEKGYEYLEIIDYEPTEVPVELFKELSKNDAEFGGIILNPHSENKFISKKELLEE